MDDLSWQHCSLAGIVSGKADGAKISANLAISSFIIKVSTNNILPKAQRNKVQRVFKQQKGSAISAANFLIQLKRNAISLLRDNFCIQ